MDWQVDRILQKKKQFKDKFDRLVLDKPTLCY